MNLARTLIYVGLGVAALGLAVFVLERSGVKLFRLPGDIVWRRRNTTVYFPIVTSIVLSVLLTLAFALFRRR